LCPINKLFDNELNKILKLEEDTRDSDIQPVITGNNSPNVSIEQISLVLIDDEEQQ
jgi:hypothetical protein